MLQARFISFLQARRVCSHQKEKTCQWLSIINISWSSWCVVLWLDGSGLLTPLALVDRKTITTLHTKLAKQCATKNEP